MPPSREPSTPERAVPGSTTGNRAAPPAPSPIPGRLLSGLNAEQHDAVTTLSGPLLVVAGPGSGKTRVLVHRVAALIATGTPPAQILAVTFTNKAAAEMRERVSALVGPPAERMWIATFHSACVRILRYNHAAAGLPNAFTIVDAADATRLLTRVMREGGLLEAFSPAEAKQEVRQTQGDISRHKNAGRHPDEVAQSGHVQDQRTAEVMRAYNESLLRIGALDFDDILLRARDLLAADEAVRARYQRRFTHLLVDEYQDTNTVQYDIVRLLAPTRSSNVCVVGDADQSIYAFRGADPSVLSSFTGDYDAKVVLLGQNYRSTSNIVEVAQAVIEPNPAAHRARLRTDNEEGAPVHVHESDTNYAEARHVADLIESRDSDLGEHAILVRTNALTRAVEQELTERRLRYQVVGALRFYDRAEIKDALAHLRLALNPADVVAFERAVSTPRRGIGEASVVALRREAEHAQVTIVDAAVARAQASSAAASRLAAFLSVHEAVTQAAHHGPAAALRAVAEHGGLRAHLKSAGARDGLDREANLDELLAYAESFTSDRSATDPESRPVSQLPGWEQTAAFLENVALVSAAETVTGEDPAAEGTVAILTMHAAKGQEYDHVYVIGLEENVCPHARALKSGSPAELEEERRLMFVAVSRARRTLELSYCRRRSSFGQEQLNPPSRFLLDLPSSVRRTTSVPGANPAQVRGGHLRRGSNTQPARHTGAAAARTRTSPQRGAGPSLSPSRVPIGTKVRHRTFGDGIVVQLEDQLVSVEFAAPVGRKTLVLSIAPLTLIEGTGRN